MSRVEAFVQGYVGTNVHIDHDGTDDDDMKGVLTWHKSEGGCDIDDHNRESSFGSQRRFTYSPELIYFDIYHLCVTS